MNLLFLSLDKNTTVLPERVATDVAARFTLLDEICREADAHVVLCADEKGDATVALLNEFFVKQGTRHIRIVGSTPQCYGSHRGHEVMAFLEGFGNDVARYVVLDNVGEYFGWQPCFRVPPQDLSLEVGYEVLRQLNPESKLLAKWESEFGFGDLLTLVERPD